MRAGKKEIRGATDGALPALPGGAALEDVVLYGIPTSDAAQAALHETERPLSVSLVSK